VNQRGIALAITLFALVLLLELATVGFLVGLEETRAGRNTVRMEHAREAAEMGIAELLAGVAGVSPDRVQVGQIVPVPWTSLKAPPGWYRGSIHRLTARLFLIRSEGFSGDRLARSEVAQFASWAGPISDSKGLELVGERSFVLVY